MNQFLKVWFVTAPGSCVLEYRGDDGLDLDLVGWRGTCSLRAYVAVPDCVHYVRLLGGDTSMFGEFTVTEGQPPSKIMPSKYSRLPLIGHVRDCSDAKLPKISRLSGSYLTWSTNKSVLNFFSLPIAADFDVFARALVVINTITT